MDGTQGQKSLCWLLLPNRPFNADTLHSSNLSSHCVWFDDLITDVFPVIWNPRSLCCRPTFQTALGYLHLGVQQLLAHGTPPGEARPFLPSFNCYTTSLSLRFSHFASFTSKSNWFPSPATAAGICLPCFLVPVPWMRLLSPLISVAIPLVNQVLLNTLPIHPVSSIALTWWW